MTSWASGSHFHRSFYGDLGLSDVECDRRLEERVEEYANVVSEKNAQEALKVRGVLLETLEAVRQARRQKSSRQQKSWGPFVVYTAVAGPMRVPKVMILARPVH